MKPLKKIPETDAIFANVAQAHQAADANPKVLRISIDSKAKVKIGNLSRGGKARTLEADQADDHDQHWEAVLVPLGFSMCLAISSRFTLVSQLKRVTLSSIAWRLGGKHISALMRAWKNW